MYAYSMERAPDRPTTVREAATEPPQAEERPWICETCYHLASVFGNDGHEICICCAERDISSYGDLIVLDGSETECRDWEE